MFVFGIECPLFRCAAVLTKFGNIGTGGECFVACAGQDDNPDVWVGL